MNASIADFHLQALSNAINAGTNSNAPYTDKDGLTRTLPIDIGCFEYQLPLNVSNNLFVMMSRRMLNRLMIRNFKISINCFL